MTEQRCILRNSYPYESVLTGQDQNWPVTVPPAGPPATGSDLTFPHPLASPIKPSTAWDKDHRRLALDHFSDRIANSGLSGRGIAVEYLKEKYRNNLAAATIRQSGSVVLSFLSFLQERDADLFKLVRQDINSFVEHKQNLGLKINSVKSYLMGVYTFVHFLVERELLPSLILHKKIRLKLPELLPRAIPTDDIKALLAVIDTIRDHALILLLLRTGMRIGELLNIKMSAIILQEKKILLYVGEKNYQGRVVYFNEDAKAILKKWIQLRTPQKEYLFYSPSREQLSYAAARKIMVKRLDQANLSHKGYSLHSLRHTFATDMLNAGLRIEVLQHILGHESIEITKRYAKMSDATREREYFMAMAAIEQGEDHEPYRVNSQLQAVFEEKKLFTTHNKKLPAQAAAISCLDYDSCRAGKV